MGGLLLRCGYAIGQVERLDAVRLYGSHMLRHLDVFFSISATISCQNRLTVSKCFAPSILQANKLLEYPGMRFI